MLDNVLSVVKEVAAKAVQDNNDIVADKKDLVVDTATNAIAGGLMDNIGDIAELFGGKGGGSNAIMDTIQKTVVSALMQKAGLNSGVASGLVSTILPAVISALSGKMGGKSGGLNLESIVGALTGGDKKEGGLGDALGSLGKLFGK